MNNKELLNCFSLKYNPFLPAIPPEDLWQPPQLGTFYWRLNNLIAAGGFALVEGEPGQGKSKVIHVLAHLLDEQSDDLVVRVIERPQSKLSDFYRELGERFDLNLSVANRYGGFATLRERWHHHFDTTLLRPVLLIDECQEMHTCCLNELRLLTSATFDSQCLLTTVLCGDTRLTERFRDRALLALGSRIRLRLKLTPYDRQTSLAFIEHILVKAGAPHIMTTTLKETLAHHAAGNFRLLTNMGTQLLEEAAHRKLPQIDEHLFLELFSRTPTSVKHKEQPQPSLR